jgi:hypothetical protein
MRAPIAFVGLIALNLAVTGCPDCGTPQTSSSSSSGSSSGAPSSGGSGFSGTASSQGTSSGEVGGCTDGGQAEWARWAPPPDQPTGYVVDAETVTDLATGLIWQRDHPMLDGGSVPAAVHLTLAEATVYCATLSLGGSTGWRLPTLVELSSLVDSAAENPAINTSAFPRVLFDSFWTSSSYAGAPAAWIVGFSTGYTSGENVGNTHAVRCVR